MHLRTVGGHNIVCTMTDQRVYPKVVYPYLKPKYDPEVG